MAKKKKKVCEAFFFKQLRDLLSKRLRLSELVRKRVMSALPKPLFIIVTTLGYKCQNSNSTGPSKKGSVWLI